MSEYCPTQAEWQEWLNELYSKDPALYERLTTYDDEETAAMLDALEEQLILMGEYDEA